jgi:CheY-like chemotaxis protein
MRQTILRVDDDESFRDVMRFHLEDRGHAVV